MADRNYVSTALTTVLAADLGASGNPSVISLPGTWPASFPYPVLIDWGTSAQEAILVTSAPTGTGPYTLPCTRGIDGTLQQAHSAGAQAEHGTTGYEPTLIQENAAAIAALEAGVGGGSVSLAGDLGNTNIDPQVLSTHLTAPLPVGQGGTGSGSQNWQGLLTPVTQTGTYTATAGQLVKANIASSSWTMKLPNAPAANTIVGAKVISNATGNANTLTVACQGSDVFEQSGGATSTTLSLLSQAAAWQYNSGYWTRVSDDLPLGQLEALFPQRAAGTSSPAATLPYFNPKDDGALFNGSTDDSADINTTLARGGTIVFPPGTTEVHANELQFSTSALHIRGSGMYDTTVQCTNGSLSTLWVYGSSFVTDVELSDMTLDGTGVSQSAIATLGNRLDRLRIRRVRFINWPAVIIQSGYAAEVIVEDCEADGAGSGLGTFFLSTNRENESVIIRRNRLRWLSTGITIGAGNPGAAQYHSAYIDISDNYIDLGWWLLKAASSNSGGTVTYSSTTVTDSSAPFGATNSIAAGTTIRALTPLQTGTLTTIGTQMTDSSGNFVTADVWRGHIVRSGTAFGVVSKVESATQLHVEEWLSQTTYQPATPPSSAPYTVYGVVLGAVVSNTSTAITVAQGAGGNGGGWYDLQGNSVTPASDTLYEVLPAHPVYPIFCNVPTEKVRICRNTVRRGWADNIEFFGSRGIITGNIVEDGQDEGIVAQGYSTTYPGIKTIISGNICRHNGTSGLCVIDQADCEIGPNQLEDNTWGAPASLNLGQFEIASCVNTTVTGGRATNSGESAINQEGLQISGASTSGVKVIGFSGHGAAIADVYITSTVPAATCDLLDVDGVIAYQGTSNGQRLRVKGTGTPSLIASPGSLFLSTSGSGTGTTLYVKESGDGSSGWDVLSTGGYTVSITSFGATTGTADIGPAVNSAIASLPSSGGTITVPPGTWTYSTPLDLASLTSVTIAGEANPGGGATMTSSLVYTGTGSASAISMQNSNAIVLRNLSLLYNSSSFTGILTDWRNVSGSDTSYGLIDNCYLGASPSTINSAQSLVNLDKCINMTVRKCNIAGATYGIYGKSSSSTYSNVVQIENCVFHAQATAHIYNAGQAWKIDTCTFEALAGGTNGAYAHDSGNNADALTFLNCWSGDGTGGTQYTVSGIGVSFLGNWIGCSAGTCIYTDDVVTGLVITGNDFVDASVALKTIQPSGSSSATGWVILANTYTSVTTNLSGNFAAGTIYHNGTFALDAYGLNVNGVLTIVDGNNIVTGNSVGTKIPSISTAKLGFWGTTPVVQQVLATGAGHTVDDVITLLQTLGLCAQ